MLIPKEYYFDSECLKDEFSHIFQKSWLFVGMLHELENHNDFITVELFGKSIVVQNFKGTLAAFKNVCAHRFSRIQTEERGNRALTCKYHGWTYDKEGIPTAIPKRSTFDAEQLNCIHLEKYQLDSCGKFVFVCMDKQNQIPLKDYLGQFHNELLEISKHIDSPISSINLPHKANWKFLLENVLEGYHCPMLHMETLIRDGFCIKTTEEIIFDKGHSKWHTAKIGNDFNAKKSKKLNFLERRTWKHDSFCHIHIYPSLVISSTEGYFFYVGNVLPQSADQTNLYARFYSPALITSDEEKNAFIQKAFFEAAVDTSLKVINEDKPLIESSQKGISEAFKSGGILSENEEVRIKEFHQVYLKHIAIHE